MWTLLLAALALAGTPPVPDGHKPLKVKHDCQFSAAPTGSDGVAPVRADCHWPEVSVDTLDALLSDWDGADRIFSSVVQSDVKSTAGGTVTFFQVHRASGISDREAMLVGTKTAVDGGFRYAWTMTGATQGSAADGRVTAGRDDGSWTVTKHPEGGARVTYRLEYDPAGSVPSWIVRSFQTGGIVTFVGELRAAAK
jgi:hypothetical protein